MSDIPADLLDAVEALHREVDAAAAPLEGQHAARLQCRAGCADCCQDGLTVFAVEAAVLRRHHPEVLDQAPGPAGGCAFLDEERRCRVYAHRPYVCRTQGLPLRWTAEGPDSAAQEGRDICPLNAPGGPPVDALPAGACWTLGPFEARLRALQERVTQGPERVSLRSLFAGAEPAPEGPNDSLRDALRALFPDR